MAEPVLTDVFVGAAQDASSLTIPKAAMPTLTAAATNSPDAMLGALLFRCTEYYTAERRTVDKDVSIVATMDLPQTETEYDATGNANTYLVRSFTVKFYQESNFGDFDADTYQ